MENMRYIDIQVAAARGTQAMAEQSRQCLRDNGTELGPASQRYFMAATSRVHFRLSDLLRRYKNDRAFAVSFQVDHISVYGL